MAGYEIIGVSEEQKKMEAGEPVFKDAKYKNGWQLNMMQLNDTFMNTTVYDESGTIKDTKTFNTQSDQEISILQKYIEWFEEAPEKNIRKMTKMVVRKQK